jgi:hypothetical protein
MKPFKNLLLLTFLMSAILLSGCASLSKGQMKSIVEFSEQYSEINLKPGNVIRSDVKAAFLDDKLSYNESNSVKIKEARDASADVENESLNNIFEEITEIRNSQIGKLKNATQLDEIIKAFEIYVSLLGSVAKADYNENIKQESQVLAASFHSALKKVPANIKSIKEKFEPQNTSAAVADVSTTEADIDTANKKITEVSSYIGALTYWAGKNYVRHQQTKALKEAVLSADPIIKDIATDLIDIIDLFIDRTKGVGTLADYMNRKLIKDKINSEKKRKLKSTFDDSGLTDNSYTVAFESKTEDWFNAAISEGRSTKKVLESFLKAHKKLGDSLKEGPGGKKGKIDFAQFVTFVKQMHSELKDVRKYQEKLEKELDNTESSASN